ncbi:ras association domain-containing protein 4-like isoform X2 [Halichondria panicea]|uniref:ras association domain-containing protein 4-like isoform X2 n=1 Tax=Halichondria panicea TaxID=6063 RepID=UPI00312B4E1B
MQMLHRSGCTINLHTCNKHQEKPYCNSCYQLLFGQEGFRKGVLMASKVGPDAVNKQSVAEKQELLSKITEYNMYKQSGLEKSNSVEKLKPKEVNGQLSFEGVLKLYWGLKKPIRLAPGVMYAKARTDRDSIYDFVHGDDAAYVLMLEEAQKARQTRYLDDEDKKRLQAMLWDHKGTMPSRDQDQESDMSMSLPAGHYSQEGSSSLPGTLDRRKDRMGSLERDPKEGVDGNAVSRSLTRGTSVDGGNSYSPRKRSASFKRISRQKKAEDKKSLKRHKYTPPHGQSTNLRVTNAIQTVDVLKMLLAKFKVENDVSEFSLCVFYDNGRKELCKDDDYPLKLRLKLGPSEDIAKLFVIESSEVEEILSAEAAEWIKFSIHELEQFSARFQEEEEKEKKKIITRFDRWRGAITQARRTCEETDV